jgi:hypothetical protein
VRGKLPHLCAVVQYTEEPGSPGVLTWSQLLDIGRSVPDSLLQVSNLQYAVGQPRGPHLVPAPGHWPLRSRLTAPGQKFMIPAAVGQPRGPHLVTAPGHWPLRSRLTAPGQEFMIPAAVGQPGGPHLVPAPGHWPLLFSSLLQVRNL